MDFRKKLLILAASSMAFAGMAYGDACGAAQINPTPAPPNLLRLEGTAELVTDLTISCTGDTLTAMTGQVIANLSLNVTSKQTSAGPPPVNEAALIITPNGGMPSVYFGTILGNSVTFGNAMSPVNFPTTPYTLRVANIRVNASSGAVATYTTESLLATNEGVVIYASSPVNVGYTQQGFAPPSLVAGSVPGNLVICTGNPVKTPTVSFKITLAEQFGGAFKTQTGAGTCGGQTCTETNGEQGSYPATPAAGGPGYANSGTLFLFSFANIASGETIYLPTTFSNTPPVGTAPLTFTLITSLTNTTPVTASIPAGSGLPANYAAITSANGTATAVYDVTSTDNTALGESATVAGYVTAAGGFATATVSPVTVTVTPAPTGSVNPTLVIPNFAASGNTALTLNGFGVCTTSLLFPFVTNQLGFDTGIVLSNTSTDPFNTTAAPGTCALNLYGAGAPSPNTGVPAPGGSQASGTTNAFQLSSVAPGFQGYVIATCNYLYAHGYAFIEYNLTQGNGVAEGYLPLVINDRGQTPSEFLTN
jgi:hypothetical protein